MSRANRMSGHQRIFTRRTAVAGAVGGMLWSGLALRLAQLQLIEGEEYARRAAENRIRLDPAPAERGRIFDRFGQELASNRRNFYVTITPENVAKGGGRMDELVKRLATLLPISKSRQARILRDAARQARFLPITVADDLTWEDFSRVNVHAPELTGVEAQVGQLRSYPLGAAFAHSVGYVGRPNDQEIARVVDALDGDAAAIRRLYKHPATRIGKTGVEYFAENWLKGQSGYKRVEVNADGRIQSELDSSDISPRRGGDVVLSFDAEIQKFAMRRFGDETGSAVVLDIESGDILALASKPALDPNDFVSGISQANYDKLRFNSDAPLYHKAYDGTYPPGSTFKMVVAAAALEAGAMTPDERVYCGGKTWFGGRYFHCWKREGHGSMDLHNAIKKSCDVYFYEMARRTGPQAIADMARRFGLGEAYALGMTGGARGVVPDDAWKRAARGEPWYDGETLNFGIGQGYLTATPLQLALMTARIARSDVAGLPNLMLHGPKPQVAATPFEAIAEDVAERLRAGMFGVTSEPGGTALRSGDLGLGGPRLAGKTGTAQVRRITKEERASGVRSNESLERRLRDHALFVAYAPTDNPRYACAVIVEHGGGGSRAAAPVARDILAETLRRDPSSKPAFSPEDPELADIGGAGRAGTEPI